MVQTRNGKLKRSEKPDLPGRLASELTELPTNWLLPPYFPFGMLSLITGHPGTGKSVLAAHLMTKARRVVLLPGYEEDLNRTLLPRLRANKINLDNVRLLDDGDWTLPHAEDKLAEVVKDFGADLLLADPIGSYMSDGTSENDGQAVRAFEESFARIGERTGAAVVGIRHPGKDPNNVMPGSREWSAVPRSIVELIRIPGPPEQRIIRPYKDSLGQNAPARYFTLTRSRGCPPRWKLGAEVDAGTAELARQTPDLVERTKIDRAKEMIPLLLGKGEMEAKDVYAAGEREKLNDKVMDRAAHILGVKRRRGGNGKNHRCHWSMPKRAPKASDSSPPSPPRGGVSVGMSGVEGGESD